MIGKNKKNETRIFIISFKLRMFDIVLVKWMIPSPINIVCNIITDFKFPNSDWNIKIIEEYIGGSIKLLCKYRIESPCITGSEE